MKRSQHVLKTCQQPYLYAHKQPYSCFNVISSWKSPRTLMLYHSILICCLAVPVSAKVGNEGLHFICLNMFSQIHRLTDRFGLEGTPKTILFHPPAMGKDAVHYTRVLRVPFSLLLNTSREKLTQDAPSNKWDLKKEKIESSIHSMYSKWASHSLSV